MNQEGNWFNQPTGSAKNACQYNGKELNVDDGLNLNDYGARYYDATVGRWMSVDPLADASQNVSTCPYGYVWNNPVLWIKFKRWGLSK